MPKPQNSRIVPKQIQIIKIAQRQLNMDDESYRQILFDEFSAASCTQLTIDQGNQLIDIMKDKGFVPKFKKNGWRSVAAHPGEKRTTKSGRNVISLASPKERAKLAAVAALIHWRVENGLELFLEKRVGIKSGKVRTAGEAYKAIEALKKMFENGMKKLHGPEWWIMQFDDERKMDYIKIHKPEEYR
ncbi:MAG: regulatory protein GemA [Desulfuromusa sp.]|nr:regulatory protein GemA [Desulfuromusa sp.]